MCANLNLTGQTSPLRRKGSYLRRNAVARLIGLTITAKPIV